MSSDAENSSPFFVRGYTSPVERNRYSVVNVGAETLVRSKFCTNSPLRVLFRRTCSFRFSALAFLGKATSRSVFTWNVSPNRLCCLRTSVSPTALVMVITYCSRFRSSVISPETFTLSPYNSPSWGVTCSSMAGFGPFFSVLIALSLSLHPTSAKANGSTNAQ